jgi:hypothetical protein
VSYSDPSSAADLENRFAYHPAATPERGEAHQAVRDACLGLAHYLDDVIPPGREKALALTNLEQVMFWANGAIARQPV